MLERLVPIRCAMPTVVEALQRGYLFRRMSDSQLERIAARARWLRLEEGQWLFQQGEPAECFFQVVAGHMKLFFLTPDGNEKVIEVLGAGSTFAEALVFRDRPSYPLNAAAISGAELLCIDSRDFASMLRQSADTCFLLLGDLSRRMHALVREIEDLTLQSATSRVAGYLLRKARPGEDRFELEVPKGVLASRLSVKAETFSRILRNLVDQGIVSVQGHTVTVHNRELLRARADLCGLAQGSLDSSFNTPFEPP